MDSGWITTKSYFDSRLLQIYYL